MRVVRIREEVVPLDRPPLEPLSSLQVQPGPDVLRGRRVQGVHPPVRIDVVDEGVQVLKPVLGVLLRNIGIGEEGGAEEPGLRGLRPCKEGLKKLSRTFSFRTTAPSRQDKP